MRYWYLLIEVAVSILVAYVTSFWVAGGVSFLVGTVVFFASELVHTRLRVAKNADALRSLVSLVENVAPRDAVSELALIYGLRSLSSVSRSSISVSPDEAWRFWKDSIQRAESRFQIASYTGREWVWSLKGWAEQAGIVHEERVRSGCRIQRVFVVDDEDERLALLSEMQSQVAIGVEVRWILKGDLDSQELVATRLSEVGTAAFAVVDDAWVWRAHLSKKRVPTGLSATRDRHTVEAGRFLFQEMWRMAHEVE